MRVKIEIINDKIRGYYQINLYKWRKKKWWKKVDWVPEFQQYIGHKYVCPEIHKKKITIEEYFQREVEYTIEGCKHEQLEEIHTITIDKKCNRLIAKTFNLT